MLEELLGSKLRTAILGWLMMHPDNRYFVRQLSSLLNVNSTNLSRELAKLSRMGILVCQLEGRQKYYQVNSGCSVYSELRGLVLKTSGLVEVIKTALNSLTEKIPVAFIYGSFAHGLDNATSDVDVMVIGDTDFSGVITVLHDVQGIIDREINPTVYPCNEFHEKVASGNHFVNTVLAGNKIFLIGDEHELEKLASEGLADRAYNEHC